MKAVRFALSNYFTSKELMDYSRRFKKLYVLIRHYPSNTAGMCYGPYTIGIDVNLLLSAPFYTVTTVIVHEFIHARRHAYAVNVSYGKGIYLSGGISVGHSSLGRDIEEAETDLEVASRAFLGLGNVGYYALLGGIEVGMRSALKDKDRMVLKKGHTRLRGKLATWRAIKNVPLCDIYRLLKVRGISSRVEKVDMFFVVHTGDKRWVIHVFSPNGRAKLTDVVKSIVKELRGAGLNVKYVYRYEDGRPVSKWRVIGYRVIRSGR